MLQIYHPTKKNSPTIQKKMGLPAYIHLGGESLISMNHPFKKPRIFPHFLLLPICSAPPVETPALRGNLRGREGKHGMAGRAASWTSR